ncbi:MAG: beta-galactosidase [Phycisphaeraceae bacterium]|nr:beta-galactosidase [Phycisphaeraceae bacterium]
MATISTDTQSIIIDGKRRWFVMGSVDYARVPRPLWAERLRAAKQAGLNCISVPVNWGLHEAIPGKFNFKDELDVASFVTMIGELGMHCFLKPGPFIGSGWDAGGLPAWLARREGMVERSAEPGFIECCSKWIRAVMKQVKDLQATSADSGPIALIQSEHEWFCGDDAAGEEYLGALLRFYRENGAKVPIVNSNNLYQSIEGEIDGWNGRDNLLAILRQLAQVRTDTPRIITELPLGKTLSWGDDPKPELTPRQALHRVAQAFSAGAHCNIGPFHGGTSFGFSAGREMWRPAAFNTTSCDCNAPLTEAGGRSELYDMMKRVCFFASSFERVFAGLDPASRPISVDPAGLASMGAGRRTTAAISVLHAQGSQGSIAWVFGDDSDKANNGRPTLTLTDGSSMGVDLTGQPVVWCLFDAILSPRATLDRCNLCAFTVVGDTFVCFGPGGAEGALSINGSALDVEVPGGRSPLIVVHEGVTVVVVNEAMIDATYADEQAVYVGCAGIDAAGAPVAHEKHRKCVRIGADGQQSNITMAAPAKAPRAISFGDWDCADVDAFIAGQSERYAVIDGPDRLERLGVATGYGWYRLRLKAAATKKTSAAIIESADRLHVAVGGEPLGVVGVGPGAELDPPPLPLKKGENTLTILADNMGRSSEGFMLLEPKGVYGSLYEVKQFAAGRATMATAKPLRPLDFRTPLWRVHDDDRTDPRRATWSFTHRRKTPILLTMDPAPVRGLVVLNDEPIHWIKGAAPLKLALTPERLRQGKNEVQIAILGDMESVFKDLVAATKFREGVSDLADKAEWAFARWEPPTPAQYDSVTKAAMGSGASRAVWWRATFSTPETDVPMFLDVSGMTKGQVFVNGRNLGRYFSATAGGKAVGPQMRLYIPAPWLSTDGENTLEIFDEHGASPKKCSLVFTSDRALG